MQPDKWPSVWMIFQEKTLHKIWLRSYPPGVPENVDVDEYHSLVELLESSIETYGDHLAFSSMGTSLTYNEFHQKINQLARFFQHHFKLQKPYCLKPVWNRSS